MKCPCASLAVGRVARSDWSTRAAWGLPIGRGGKGGPAGLDQNYCVTQTGLHFHQNRTPELSVGWRSSQFYLD